MSHATGQDSGIRVDHYAAMHGEQVGTVRKRIQRGQLAGYKGTDHRWYVLPDDATDATRDKTHDATGQDRTRDMRQESVASVAVNPNARAQLEAIRDEWLQPLVETIARQAEQIGRLQAERDGATSQLLAKDETIAELRRRAEMAEQADSEPSALEQGQARLLAERGTALHAKEEVLTMQRRTIATLREEVMQLKIEREQQAASAAPSALETPPEAQAAAPAVWGRLRRWWGGGVR